MILDRIVEAKRKEVAYLKGVKPLARLKEAIEDLPPPRDFRRAIHMAACSIIAEIKQRSPSQGRLRNDFDPLRIATIYQENGAAALSVLTDKEFFEGTETHLSGIRGVVDLPLLRKDFIIDSYQIYETRLLGGDALLLIACLLEEGQLRDYILLAEMLGVMPLVEVHTRDDINKALTSGSKVIGINNRNLNTFSTDITITLDLYPLIPEDRIVVSESGINNREDIDRFLTTLDAFQHDHN